MARGTPVAGISWTLLLEQLCIDLNMPPPVYNCSSTADGRYVASVTIEYREPEAPEEPCVETPTEEPKDSEDEAKRDRAETLLRLKKVADLCAIMREEGEDRDNPRVKQMLDSVEQLISNFMEQEDNDGTGDL
ncbi:hypothetical protein EJB05_43234 [Eragrostis curvula]|uniref:Uncharacterized protein n=1 Tax=Eragrostis curvula TaxID=38414 RepID=A0A5J9TEB2_9POAL|nr:hypothetical protein EJB05_43234 [Eragrostis curvula]